MNIILNFIWKYKELFLIGAIVLYLWYVFEDRANLKQEVIDLKAEVVRIEKQQSLTDQITQAVQKIKVQSVNYVTAIEASNAPVNSGTVMLIDAGVFNPTVYKTNVTDNTTSSSKKD